VYGCEIQGCRDTVVKVFWQEGTSDEWPGTIQSEILGLEATGSQYILCYQNRKYYLVLRNCGKNIEKIWEDEHPYNGFPLPYFLSLLVGVCKALVSLHSQDVVHGDVRASNIVTSGTNVTLIDYGMCHHLTSDFRTDPFASEQLTPGTQYGLAYHKVCDPRALLVVIFRLVLQGNPCRVHSVTKNRTKYRIQIVSENFRSNVHDILEEWPVLRDAVLVAHDDVVNFDKKSLLAIKTATCDEQLDKELKMLSEEYDGEFRDGIEKIISTSATTASSSHDTTSTNSVSQDSPAGAANSVSSDSSDRPANSVSSDSSGSPASSVSSDSSGRPASSVGADSLP